MADRPFVHAPAERHMSRPTPARRPAAAPHPIAALGTQIGNAALTRLLMRDKRYDKFDPAPSTAGDLKLEEHHTIPYDRLEAFAEAVRDDRGDEALRFAVQPLIRPWAKVTVGELLRLHELPDGIGFESQGAMPAAELLPALEEEKRTAPRVVTIGGGGPPTNLPIFPENRQAQLDQLTRVKRKWQGLTSDADQQEEVDVAIVMSYWTWNHANLFVGPEDRVWKAKNSFDTYARYVMPPARYQALKTLDEQIRRYLDQGPGSAQRAQTLKKIRRSIRTLAAAYNNRIPFTQGADGQWEQAPSGKWRPRGAPDTTRPPDD